jgi:hypothetical protein
MGFGLTYPRGGVEVNRKRSVRGPLTDTAGITRIPLPPLLKKTLTADPGFRRRDRALRKGGNVRDGLSALVAALAVLASAAASAQQSASFKLEESTFNSGGNPGNGPSPASASNKLTLSSIGDGSVAASLSSASFHLAINFVSAYPPPVETSGLRFSANKQTLTWSAVAGADDYNLYRGGLASLSALGYGSCFQQHISGSTTADAAVPSVGTGFFYLVTAENLLDEEGTKGFASSGAERAGTVCP